MPKSPRKPQSQKTQSRSIKAVNDILTAGKNLIEGKDIKSLSARRVAKESGYSLGNIYHHFKKLSDIFIQIYTESRTKSQKEIAQMFIEHDPNTPAIFLAEKVTDRVLSQLNEFDPKILTFCLTAQSRDLRSPFDIDDSVEKLVEIFNETIKRDKTKTFRKMTKSESYLLSKVYVYALRQPYIDENELMGTEEHRQIIIKLFLDLFGEK